MRGRFSSRIVQVGLLLALAALVTACNVGVGLSASIPAPWGYVDVDAGTNFPSHPHW
jgi:hypothetical protein